MWLISKDILSKSTEENRNIRYDFFNFFTESECLFLIDPIQKQKMEKMEKNKDKSLEKQFQEDLIVIKNKILT